jgi:hypothetical protein
MIAHEIDAAQADSVADLLQRRRLGTHAAPPGTPCANCSTPLQGPWCHACGQLGEDFHRSWFHLVAESVEGLLHLDGRFWRTLPDLVLRPARLTRRYLEGHRVPQIPPLRLFLVVLLLVFFAGSVTSGKVNFIHINARPSLTDAQRAKVKEGLSHANIQLGRPGDQGPSKWFREHASKVVDNPEAFRLILESWSERFAFLMLPIAALLMSVLFIFQRRFYLFDHLIFSMHSLSFLGLLIAATFFVGQVLEPAAGWLLLAAPIHLFAHMKGVYQASVFGTLLRMFLLFVGSLVGFVFLMVGLVFVGLANL